MTETKKFRIMHKDSNSLYGAIFTTENVKSNIDHAVMCFLKRMDSHKGTFIVQYQDGTEWVNTDIKYVGTKV